MSKTDSDAKALGKAGEDLAAQIVTDLGWQIVERNWRCRYGEIDLIAIDPVASNLVFIEVKTRRTACKGTPAEAVTVQKQRRLRKLVGAWRTDPSRHLNLPPRIDVIALLWPKSGPVKAELRQGVA